MRFIFFTTFAQKYNKFSVRHVDTLKDNSNIFIEDYNYPLPDHRIAKYPLKQRDASKLLIYRDGAISESVFSQISDYLPENSLLIYNNTRVIQARLLFSKDTGARIEVFCLEPLLPADYALSLGSNGECVWKCMVGNLKKWKDGPLTKTVNFDGRKCTLSVSILSSEGNTHTIKFSWDNSDIHFAGILENTGELPIPPYLHRKTEESDLETYQTIYSKIKGSVAAPTAGLHFTDEVLNSLKQKNINIAELTLHVGAGTFQPVKTENIADHQMHTELISVPRTTIELILRNIGNIVAVGTTSVRTLESLYYAGVLIADQNPVKSASIYITQWLPYTRKPDITVHEAMQNILNYLDRHSLGNLVATTQIMIRPGYEFQIVNAMITNFHQPKSTLLLLVSAFVNGNWKSIYDYALNNDFRFLSYGDSSLLMK